LFKLVPQICLNKRINRKILAVDGSVRVLNSGKVISDCTNTSVYDDLIMTLVQSDYPKIVVAPSTQSVTVDNLSVPVQHINVLDRLPFECIFLSPLFTGLR
jgi:hypothetical protein